jgi:NifB/MoaA-like Fe-S oxidoreductase
MSAKDACALIQRVSAWADRAREERGTSWVFGSDELYLLAGLPLPGAEHYEDFAQIENGIGAVASLRQRVARGLSSLRELNGTKIGVVTGKAMAELMPDLLDKMARQSGAEFELIVTENSLFGPTITTAGLLVGADIKRVLDSRSDLSFALIPAETINEDGVFLDDVRFEDLCRELPIPVYPSYDFVDALSDEDSLVAA